MVRTSFAEKKQKRKKKIRLKQYVSLRSKGRHKYLGWTEVKQYTPLPLRGAGV
jgi:hypothetical protein